MATPKKVTVTLETLTELKSAVKFTTEADDVSPNNVYIKKDAWTKIGKPQQVKVTVEAA